MTYTIGTATTPNATWGAYYNSIGEIQDEKPKKSANLVPYGMFGSDSSETDVFDYGGTVRKIVWTVVKVFDGATASADKAKFAQALDTLINGDQSYSNNYPITIHSDTWGDIKVKIDEIAPENNINTPCELKYVITFIESSDNG